MTSDLAAVHARATQDALLHGERLEIAADGTARYVVIGPDYIVPWATQATQAARAVAKPTKLARLPHDRKAKPITRLSDGHVFKSVRDAARSIVGWDAPQRVVYTAAERIKAAADHGWPRNGSHWRYVGAPEVPLLAAVPKPGRPWRRTAAA